MPEGKMISFGPGEYPELDGLPEGTKVSFSGQATLVQGGLQIDSMDMDAEGEATRELKKMTGNDDYSAGETKSGGF